MTDVQLVALMAAVIQRASTEHIEREDNVAERAWSMLKEVKRQAPRQAHQGPPKLSDLEVQPLVPHRPWMAFDTSGEFLRAFEGNIQRDIAGMAAVAVEGRLKRQEALIREVVSTQAGELLFDLCGRLRALTEGDCDPGCDERVGECRRCQAMGILKDFANLRSTVGGEGEVKEPTDSILGDIRHNDLVFKLGCVRWRGQPLEALEAAWAALKDNDGAE